MLEDKAYGSPAASVCDPQGMTSVAVSAPADFWREVDRMGGPAALLGTLDGWTSDLLSAYIRTGTGYEASRIEGWRVWRNIVELRAEVEALESELKSVAATLDRRRGHNLAQMAEPERLSRKGNEIEERRIDFFAFPVIERDVELPGQRAEAPLEALAEALYRRQAAGLSEDSLRNAYQDLAARLAGLSFSVAEIRSEQRRLNLRRNALRQAASLFH
jgi:hypothetical protein